LTLNTSYRQIFSLSFPLMLGSAVQNIIALTDSVFLYHLSEVDFAAIGFVGVFYLIIAAIGFGFSKGGQIIIARRYGEDNLVSIGPSFYAMVYFEIILAIIMFLAMKFLAPIAFGIFVNSPEILEKSINYLDYRAYGVFFSYMGVAIVALYTGVVRTTFIIVDTIILLIANIFLNYVFIFGHFGFESMGIAGAGLASTLSEIIAFVCFIIYILFDREARKYHLFRLPKFDWPLIKNMVSISSPMVMQGVLGMSSWFVFFSLVENMGERELAITNLARIVYLICSIPIWGFSTGINSHVSGFIGNQKRNAVMPIIFKTSKVSLGLTLLISLPILIFPKFFLYPLLGSEDMSLITDAQNVFYILIVILIIFSVAAIYFNGLTGTGATLYGLKLQSIGLVVYLGLIYFVIHHSNLSIEWAWASEIVYWLLIIGMSIYYLRSGKWQSLKV